jgi:hypothetical protein
MADLDSAVKSYLYPWAGKFAGGKIYARSLVNHRVAGSNAIQPKEGWR